MLGFLQDQVRPRLPARPCGTSAGTRRKGAWEPGGGLDLYEPGAAAASRSDGVRHRVALTLLQTTDFFLDLVRHERGSLVKVLTLYSARNRSKLDRQGFFDANANLASTWYLVYGSLYRTGVVNREVLERLQDHFQFR